MTHARQWIPPGSHNFYFEVSLLLVLLHIFLMMNQDAGPQAGWTPGFQGVLQVPDVLLASLLEATPNRRVAV